MTSISVSGVGAQAYQANVSLQSATIAGGDIGEFAFYGCTALTNVSLGASVTGVLAYAFYGNSSLTSITIPASVTRIGDCAFADCSSLTTVILGSASTTISECAFMASPNVVVTYPNGTTATGEAAGNGVVSSSGNFLNINQLTKTVYGYKTTGTYPYVSLVAIPSGVEYMTHDSNIDFNFQTIPGVKGYFIPATLKTFQDGYGELDMEYLQFSLQSSSSRIDIPTSAFMGSKLRSLVIPPRVRFAGDTNMAFASISTLTSVRFKNGFRNDASGELVFSQCSNLATVVFEDISGIDVNGYLQLKNWFSDTDYLTSLSSSANNISGLNVSSAGEKDIIISWSAPPTNSPIIAYEVRIDDQLQATVRASEVSYRATLTDFKIYAINVRMVVDGTTNNQGDALSSSYDLVGLPEPTWWSAYTERSTEIKTTLARRYAPVLISGVQTVNYYLSNGNAFSGGLADWGDAWAVDISQNRGLDDERVNLGYVMQLYIYQAMMASSDAAVRAIGKAQIIILIPHIIQLTPTIPATLTVIGGRNQIYTTWLQPNYFWDAYRHYNLYVDGTLSVSDISGTTQYILPNISTGTHTVEVSAVNLLGSEGTKKSANVVVSSAPPQWLTDISDAVHRTVLQDNGEAAGLNDLIILDNTQNVAVRSKIFGSLTLSVQPPGVPGKPANDIYSSATGNKQLTVVWTPDPTDYPVATNYQIMATDTSTYATWMIDTSSNATSYAVNDLSAGIFYQFSVRGVNSIGTGEWSSPSIAVEALTTPGAPSYPILSTTGLGRLTMTWTPPIVAANSQISSYTIELVDVSDAANTVTLSNIAFFPVSVVNKTSIYKFRVLAINSFGTGAWSAYSNLAEPNALPTAPLDLSGAFTLPRSQDVYLEWKDASLNNGPDIISYVISVNGVKTDTLSTMTSYIVTGLTYGTTYSIAVHAKNVNGLGPASNSLSFIPQTVPAAPTITDITTLDLSATVVWTPPTFIGGAPIQTYTVYTSNNIPILTDISNSKTSQNVDLTDSGSSYMFAISATNSVGEGARSEWFGPIMPFVAVPPSAPLNFNVTWGANLQAQYPITVTWDAPIFDGDAPITGYSLDVYYAGSMNTVDVSADTSFYILSTINQYEPFLVTISARNRAGKGPYSIANWYPLPNYTAVPSGDRSILISWGSPTLQGLPDVSSYTVSYRDISNEYHTVSTVDTSLNLTNLVAKNQYLAEYENNVMFPIQTSNNVAYAQISVIPTYYQTLASYGAPYNAGGQLQCSPVTAPGTVTGLSASMSAERQIRVDWAQPLHSFGPGTIPNTGGSPITSYLLDICSNTNRIQAIVSGGITSYTTNTMIAGDYTIRVAAANAYVSGAYADGGVVSLIRLPDPPTDISTMSMSFTSALLWWTAPANSGGRPILTYDIEYLGLSNLGMSVSNALTILNQGGSLGTPLTVSTTADEVYKTLTGLNDATDGSKAYDYFIRVRTNTEIGASSWSEYVGYNRNDGFVGIIPSISAKQLDNNIVIEWIPPTESGVQYILDVSSNGTAFYGIYMGSNSTYTYKLGGLPLEEGIYEYRVRADSGYGSYGPWAYSNKVDYRILPLNVPANVVAVQQNTNISVSWGPIGGADWYYVAYSINGVWQAGWEQTTTTSFTFPNYLLPLTGGAAYRFKIMAVDVSGDSWGQYADAVTGGWAYSNTVTFTTGDGAVCFMGNAPVLTPAGYRSMDSLHVGDYVKTADGRSVKIQRVFHQEIEANNRTNPYRIARGQFGAIQNVLVSPDHRIMVAGRGLVEAKHLGLPQVNRTGTLNYYNLELPDWRRDNMVVAGVEAESLAPVRRMRVDGATFIQLLRKQYGETLTPATLEKIKKQCVFMKDGTVEIPVMARAYVDHNKHITTNKV